MTNFNQVVMSKLCPMPGGESKDEERKKHPLFEEERKDDPKLVDGKSLEQFEAAFTQVRNYATCHVKTRQGTG